MISLDHTPESVRAKLCDHCVKTPHTSIEELIRTAANLDAGTKKDASIADCLRALAEKPGMVLAAVLGMRAGDMAGEVAANQHEAKALAEKIVFRLMNEGKAMTKPEMAAAGLPGVNLANSPQDTANFKAALALLNEDKNVIRRTSDKEIAKKRWDTMEWGGKPVAAAKPGKQS